MYFPVEAGSDVLICGECRSEFPLGDIVRFIRHKVHRCNKENVHPYKTDNDDEDEARDEAEPALIGSRRPSINAPIGLKTEAKPQQHHPMNLSMEMADESKRREERREEGAKAGHRDRLDSTRDSGKPARVDAESNTVNSGEIFLDILMIYDHLLVEFPENSKSKNDFSIGVCNLLGHCSPYRPTRIPRFSYLYCTQLNLEFHARRLIFIPTYRVHMIDVAWPLTR